MRVERSPAIINDMHELGKSREVMIWLRAGYNFTNLHMCVYMQHLLKRKEGMRLVELSSIEIAEWFQKSKRTIQSWIKQGKLSHP
jgi:hypothetical protein